MATDLTDKVAAVTGGTRGIGYSIADALLAEGVRVFICGRSESSLRGALRSLGSHAEGRVDGTRPTIPPYGACASENVLK